MSKFHTYNYNRVANYQVTVHHIPRPFSYIKLGVLQYEKVYLHLLFAWSESLKIGMAEEPNSTWLDKDCSSWDNQAKWGHSYQPESWKVFGAEKIELQA